jgi:hypothetical protein
VLGQPIGERWLLDKNPAMTLDIPVLLRIFPEGKFFVAVRDPRDVCLSCFMQPAPLLPETVGWLSLEGAIEHYTVLMGSWLAWKSAIGDASMEVRYEDLVHDLPAAARRALDFLGLPWHEGVLGFYEHAKTKTVRSPTFAEVTRPVFTSSIGRWRNYEKFFEPHLETLSPYLRAFGYE